MGGVSEAAFTFEYSLYSHRVRGVYLPVTLTADDRAAHLVVRVDCASTYSILEVTLGRVLWAHVGQW